MDTVNNTLTYYEGPDQQKCKGVYRLCADSSCTSLEDHNGRNNLFCLQARGDNLTDILVLCAESTEARESWIIYLNGQIKKTQLLLDESWSDRL